MNKLNGNQKILVSVAAFVLIMVAVVGVLFALGTKDEQTSSEKNTYAGQVSEIYEDSSAESLTSLPVTTSPAMNTVGITFSQAEQAIMNAYTSGNYYLSGAIHADGTITPIDIAMSGKNFYTTTEMDGMNMGVMYLNGKVYFINNQDKKYLDFQTIAALAGGNLGFDMSELDALAESMDMTQYNFQELEKTETKLDGEDVICYKFFNSEMALWFYFAEDELRQIDLGSADGQVVTSTVVDKFLPEVPAGMLSLNGLTMSTIFDFFGEDFYKSLQ